ncbi:MAG: penicillin-binding protein 2 [Patescibacteria group bacterium]
MKAINRLFPIAEEHPLGDVRKRHETDVFDEAFAEAHRFLDDQPTRHFLGVTINRNRLRLGAVLCLVSFLFLIGRAGHLQILQGNDYRALAEGNRVRIEYLPSLRGVIYDRNHRILAQNSPTFQIIATPANLPADEWERVIYLMELSSTLNISIAELLSRLSEGDANPYDQIVLVQDIPYNEALAFLLVEKNYQGLRVEISTRRSYVTDAIPSLSHLLGYTGVISKEEYKLLSQKDYRRIDHVGKLGLESVYESALRGIFGRKIIETDAYGNEVSVIIKQDPQNGANLVLSIDANLTAKIEQVIADAVGTSARTAVVVMDPRDGQILALVSTPAYDANLFTNGIDQATYQALLDDPNRPLFARAVSGEYPSGSTFKPIVAAAALAEGLIDRNTSFISSGGISIGPWFFPDWKSGGHGATNVTKAIAESVNTFFYIIGGGFDTFAGLGVEKIVSSAMKFGLGAPLGIDLTGEASGFLPTKAWKQEAKGERWYIGDTYHVAIGQGDLLLTPLQLSAATMVFANGGTLYEPHVGYALETADGVQRIDPVVLNEQVMEPSVIEIVREGLRETVLSGSASSLQYLPVSMAGKTGTAQWSSTKLTHAWFTGFAPYENPELVVTVLVEEAGGGDVVAVPIAKEIVRWWYSQNDVVASSPATIDVLTPTPVE